MENILDPTAGKQRLEATHFIEQYCAVPDAKQYNNKITSTSPMEIEYLEGTLAITKTLMSSLHTIAIFKIKIKTPEQWLF